MSPDLKPPVSPTLATTMRKSRSGGREWLLAKVDELEALIKVSSLCAPLTLVKRMWRASSHLWMADATTSNRSTSSSLG